MKLRILTFLTTMLVGLIARTWAEDIRVSTYNVEHFSEHFEGRRLTTQKWGRGTDEQKEILNNIRHDNDRENWAVATTIQDPAVNPDIIVFEECCGQDDLEYFNHHWLHDAYKDVMVFKSNSETDQNIAMMVKPGFTILERKDQYYLEKDPGTNSRGDRLFARGPVFLKFKSPGGWVFWVGMNHMKSKYKNSAEVTQWRNREATRCHELMLDLSKDGTPMLFLGDMNDELGPDGEYETPANGGDSIANVLGPAADGFVLETRPLVGRGEISFGGYWRDQYRSFIDHAFASPAMAPHVTGASVFQDKLAAVASDHYPVTVTIDSSDAPHASWPPPGPATLPAKKPTSREAPSSDEMP